MRQEISLQLRKFRAMHYVSATSCHVMAGHSRPKDGFR